MYLWWSLCKNKNKQKQQQRMYLWWSLCTLYLHACQVRVTIGDSRLCCVLVLFILSAN